jgi:preprotein translocase subunit SecB
MARPAVLFPNLLSCIADAVQASGFAMPSLMPIIESCFKKL